MNAILIISLLLAITNTFSFTLLLDIFIIKVSIDFLLFYKTTSFFMQKHLLKSYPISSFIYPFFSVYIAVLSVFINYKWKNRAYRK
jgi:hypothetical protein